MTYCLAIQFNDGLVFCSDSRTNAGPDRVSTYSKMHRFSVTRERSLVLLTAGNLATSQAVVAQLHRDLADDNEMNIAKARYVSEIADYIGQISSVERAKYQKLGGPDAEGFDASATFILGAGDRGPFAAHLLGGCIVEEFPFCTASKIWISCTPVDDQRIIW